MSHQSAFGHCLRLRTGGLLVEDDAILLVKLRSPVTDEMIWMPPGGEVEYGESVEDALKREFQEEVQIKIRPHSLLHVNEMIKKPFHAVELYFEVRSVGNGQPKVGVDPELKDDHQLIEGVEWVPLKELANRKFAPQSLIPKLTDWPNRSAAATFSE